MPTLPTTEDVRKAGEQVSAAFAAVLEQAKTPLLAALGAGDLAGKALTEALTKARTQVNERAEAARTAVDDLPGLREKLDPSELRKLLDTYTTAAANLYSYLAEHGEETLEKLREQPQVKVVLEQVGDLQHRADDVLGQIARRTRSAGEKAAEATEEAAEDLAEAVVEAGGDIAAETRSATRKAANKVSAPRKPAAEKAEKPAGETTES
jgi:heparin binding hemagglutinin HbhA